MTKFYTNISYLAIFVFLSILNCSISTRYWFLTVNSDIHWILLAITSMIIHIYPVCCNSKCFSISIFVAFLFECFYSASSTITKWNPNSHWLYYVIKIRLLKTLLVRTPIWMRKKAVLSFTQNTLALLIIDFIHIDAIRLLVTWETRNRKAPVSLRILWIILLLIVFLKWILKIRENFRINSK